MQKLWNYGLNAKIKRHNPTTSWDFLVPPNPPWLPECKNCEIMIQMQKIDVTIEQYLETGQYIKIYLIIQMQKLWNYVPNAKIACHNPTMSWDFLVSQNTLDYPNAKIVIPMQKLYVVLGYSLHI